MDATDNGVNVDNFGGGTPKLDSFLFVFYHLKGITVTVYPNADNVTLAGNWCVPYARTPGRGATLTRLHLTQLMSRYIFQRRYNMLLNLCLSYLQYQKY